MPRLDEIEITPAMLEAGVDVFFRYSGGAEILIGDEETAAYAIFRAMVAAAPSGAFSRGASAPTVGGRKMTDY